MRNDWRLKWEMMKFIYLFNIYKRKFQFLVNKLLKICIEYTYSICLLVNVTFICRLHIFQGRFINQLDKQCNIVRRWFCDFFCIRVHGSSKWKVYSGCSDWRTRPSVYRLSCCYCNYAWFDVLGAHLLHDVAYTGIG